jgi:hypothetical protein
MKELDFEQRLLASARRGLSPAAADAERVRARLAALLPASAELDLDDGTATPELVAPSLAPAASWLGKALVLAAVAGGSATVGYVAGRSESAAEGPRIVLTVPERVAATASGAEPAPASAPPSLPAASASAPAPRASVTSSARPALAAADALEHEAQTLRRVERALRAKNPQLALALLAELDADVPRGKLGEERRAAFTVASCEIGFGASRQSLLEKFVAQHPASVYLARVRTSCAEAPSQTESGERGDSSSGEVQR